MFKLFSRKTPNRLRPTTGLTSSPKPLYSYYKGEKAKNSANTNEIVRKRQFNDKKNNIFSKLRLAPTVVVVVIIIISIVYSTTLSTSPYLVFAGGSSSYRTNQDYKNIITKIFDSSVFNKSKLTIDTNKIEKNILINLPEVDVSSTVLPVIGRRPTVTLHVRKPALILTTATNALIIDYAGKVVANASQLLSSERDKLITIEDQSGIALKIGDQATTSETVDFILNVEAQLQDKNIKITQAVLPKVANEVDFHLKDIPYFIKTDSSGEARLQIGAFIASKGSGVSPSEYMDLRVEEKIFYK